MLPLCAPSINKQSARMVFQLAADVNVAIRWFALLLREGTVDVPSRHFRGFVDFEGNGYSSTLR